MKSYTSNNLWDLITRCGTRVSRIGGDMRINMRDINGRNTNIIISVLIPERCNIYDEQFQIKPLSKVNKVRWFKTDNECELLSQLKMGFLMNKLIHDTDLSDKQLWNMTLDIFKENEIDLSDRERKAKFLHLVRSNIRSKENLLKYKFKMEYDKERIEENVKYLNRILNKWIYSKAKPIEDDGNIILEEFIKSSKHLIDK